MARSGTTVFAVIAVACSTSLHSAADAPRPGVDQAPAADVVAAALGTCRGDAGFDLRADLNGDGCVNVLDVMVMRGLPAGGAAAAPEGAGPTELIVLDGPELQLCVGETESMLFLLRQNTTPLFGYSLDIDIVPAAGATGSVTVNVGLTNFFEVRNLITAGGAVLDPLFSVILDTGDGGVFVSANTADGSTVLAVDDVNDVLVEVFFEASPDADGDFMIELGPGSALSDGSGFAVPFAFTAGVVVAGGQSADLDDDGVVGIVDFLALLGDWGPCPVRPSDLDGDGEIGIQDFLILLGVWGPCNDEECPADLNDNGEVGIQDFLILLGDWGLEPLPCADLDCDGVVGIIDFLSLLAQWG